MTIIMGIDPGVTGAIAFYFPMVPNRIAVDDVPVAGGEINTAELARVIRIHRPTLAVIERVSAMPGNGAVSMFNFGRSYGDVRGVIGAMEIPLHFVTPQKWKKHFGLSADKEQSRLRAIRMFPSAAESFKLKKHDGRAEAALIALYGAEVLQSGGGGVKRYSIIVRKNFAEREVELLQVDSHPESIVKGLQQKTVVLFDGKKNKRTSMPKFESIRIVENAGADK